MFARPFIDSLDFAKNGSELHGEIAVAKLSRLTDLLYSPEGTLSYYVSGHRDSNGISSLKISLRGRCELSCQRCLGKLDHTIELANEVVLASSLDEDSIMVEVTDCIEASRNLDILDLIEDELLLSLPFAPKHTAEECRFVNDSLVRPESQFSTLGKLM